MVERCGGDLDLIDRDEHAEDVEALIREFDRGMGQFALIVVHCDFALLRRYLIQEIVRQSPPKTIHVLLDPQATDLLDELRQSYERERFDVILVDGLDDSEAKQSIVRSASDDREEFRSKLPTPMVLFVSKPIARLFAKQGSHFLSVRTLERRIDFTDVELRSAIDRTASTLCQKLIDEGAGVHPSALKGMLAPITPMEVPLAAEVHHERGLDHEVQTRAQIELLQGLVGGDGEESDAPCNRRPIRCHYRKSVNLCRGKPSQELVAASYLLGLWYMQYGMLYAQYRRQAFALAARHYSHCLCAVTALAGGQGRRRFINAVADALRREVRQDLIEARRGRCETRFAGDIRSQTFKRLREVSEEAVGLHLAASDTRRLARAQAYLALVALDFDADPKRARELAVKALALQERWMQEAKRDYPELVNWELKYHRGFYFLVLAGAELATGRVEDAIKHLDEASQISDKTYDPQLFDEILESQVHAYRSCSRYADAFSSAMELSNLRQSYGKSVFAGLSSAERLYPLTNPVFQDIRLDQSTWQFGRADTIEKIVSTIRDPNRKHTVLYGPRGVGKSSLLRAGVLPRFKSAHIAGKPVRFHKIDLLGDWRREICGWVETDCSKGNGARSQTAPEPNVDCLSTLHTPACYCVLVLDDVDELVMSHKRREERKPFWQLLARFSAITSTKIILTLDQDFLYALAEFLEAIKDDRGRSRFDIEDLHLIERLSPGQVRRSLVEFSPQRLRITQDVIDELLDHVQSPEGGIQPLLLQIVGAQLEKVADAQGRAVSLADWKALDKGAGQKEHLIHSFLREIFDEFMDDELKNAAMRCAYLLSSGSNVWERTWISAAEVDSVINRTDDRVTTKQVEQSLDMLCDARLLKRRIWTDGAARYRYAHESLVRYLRTFAETEYWEQVRKLVVSQDVVVVERHNAASREHLLRHDNLSALVEIMRSQRICAESGKIPAKLLSDTADRLRTILYGSDEINRMEDHKGDVNSLSFSGDGSILVSGGSDDKIIVWERSGKNIQQLIAHGRWVTSVKVNPAGTCIAAGCTDGTVKLWALDGKPMRPHAYGKPTKNWVYSIKFLPDGCGIVAAYQDEPIKIWDVGTGELRKEIPNGGGRTFCIDVSPDGQRIASGHNDRCVRIRDLDGNVCYESEDTGADVYVVKFSNFGRYLAYTDGEKDFCLMELRSGDKRTIQGHTRAVNSIAFNADDSLVVTGSNDNTVRLWRVDDGSLIRTYQGHTTWVRYVVFDPRGEFVASAGEDHSIRFWRMDFPLPTNLMLKASAIHGVSFCGPDLLVTGGWDKHVKMSDRRTGEILWDETHDDWIWDVAVSPDLAVIAASGGDKIITLRSARDGSVIAKLEGHDDCVHSMAFSPSGRQLASASGDGTVRVWRSEAGDWHEESTLRYEEHVDQVWGVCFDKTGQVLASGGSDQKVHIWSLDGRVRLKLDGHTHWINSLAFHPSGDELASASNDGDVRIWRRNGEHWDEKTTIKGGLGKVYIVAYDPKGRFLASAGVDGLVKIWTRDGRLWRNLQGHAGAVNALSVSPDGLHIASAGDDQVVKIWPLKPVPEDPPNAAELMEQARLLIHDYLSNNSIQV